MLFQKFWRSVMACRLPWFYSGERCYAIRLTNSSARSLSSSIDADDMGCCECPRPFCTSSNCLVSSSTLATAMVSSFSFSLNSARIDSKSEATARKPVCYLYKPKSRNSRRVKRQNVRTVSRNKNYSQFAKFTAAAPTGLIRGAAKSDDRLWRCHAQMIIIRLRRRGRTKSQRDFPYGVILTRHMETRYKFSP